MSVTDPKPQRPEIAQEKLFKEKIDDATTTKELKDAQSELDRATQGLDSAEISVVKRAKLALELAEKKNRVEKAEKTLKQLQVMQEIYSTELSYKQNINQLWQFVNANKAEFEKTTDGRKLFVAIAKINSIIAISNELLDELKPPMKNIQAVFERYGPKLFEAYREYVSAYSEIGQLLTKCKEQKSFSKLVAKFLTDPAHKGLSLESFLVMPVQRVPRYVLLLTELNKHTPVSFESAIDAVRKSAADINTAIREAQNFAALSKRKDSPESRKARSIPFDPGTEGGKLHDILPDKTKRKALEASLRAALNEPNLTIDKKGVVRIGDQKFKIVQGGVEPGDDQKFYIRIKNPKTISGPQELVNRRLQADDIGKALSGHLNPKASVAERKETVTERLQHATSALNPPPPPPVLSTAGGAKAAPALVTLQSLTAGRAALQKRSEASPTGNGQLGITPDALELQKKALKKQPAVASSATGQQSGQQLSELQRQWADRAARRAANAAPSASEPNLAGPKPELPNPEGPKPDKPPRRRP